MLIRGHCNCLERNYVVTIAAVSEVISTIFMKWKGTIERSSTQMRTAGTGSMVIDKSPIPRPCSEIG